MDQGPGRGLGQVDSRAPLAGGNLTGCYGVFFKAWATNFLSPTPFLFSGKPGQLLGFNKAGIESSPLHQFLVRAAVDDGALIQHDDAVGTAYG